MPGGSDAGALAGQGREQVEASARGRFNRGVTSLVLEVTT